MFTFNERVVILRETLGSRCDARDGSRKYWSKGQIKDLKGKVENMEGRGSYGFGDVAGLCLVQEVMIPPNFKVLV